jgi:agmatinase
MKFVDDPEEADIILFGAPVDQGTENLGCSEAPTRVRANIDNFYLSETGNENKIFDKSDIVEGETFEKTMDNVFHKTVEFLKTDKKIICIGGNHSISLPIVEALSRFYNKIGIIHIDAHPDAQVDYYPYGDVIGAVSNIPEVEKIAMLGLRNWSKYEYEFISKSNKIKVIPMKNIADKNIKSIAEEIENYLEGCDAIYVTLDMDAIDPAFAPGTGCLEPAGLTSRQIIEFLQRISQNEKTIGMDIVEINPNKDINDMTSILGAKIIFEFANSLVIR